MEEIGKKIKDLQDKIKQEQRTLRNIEGLPVPTDEVLDETRANLNLAEEEGILYLKRSVMDSLLTFIKNSKEALPDLEQFKAQLNVMYGLLLTVYIQRLISIGKVEPTGDERWLEQHTAQETEGSTLVSVIKEVNELVKNDKNALKINEIKRIMYFIDEMKKARKSYHQVAAHTMDDKKKETYKRNFQRIAGSLELRIKAAYRLYESGTQGKDASSVSLAAIPLKKLSPVLNVQLESLIKFYVTLDFAARQGRSAASILVPLAIDVKNVLELIDREEVIFRSFFSEQYIDAGKIKAMAQGVAVSFGLVIPLHLKKVAGITA